MQLNSNITLPGLEEGNILDTEVREGIYYIRWELERTSHRCPQCGEWTNKVHDYRTQKVRHPSIFGRQTIIFYRKRRYKCVFCGKRFFERNPLVKRYKRQSIEFNQVLSLELVHGKSFRDVATRFHTSPTTIMRRFDEITASKMKETQALPKVIAIDEYKGDAGNEKYQTVIADPINRKPLEILKDRKKDTLVDYLRMHGEKVEFVVMDMSPSFKAAVDKALGHPIVIADRFHFTRYIYWALERVRIRVQREFHDYDRKKCKRMRHVFYKKQSKLTKKQQWYLDRYLHMSPDLKRAHELKEAYNVWFQLAKANGPNALKNTKKYLYQFYELVQNAGLPEFLKAKETFHNWQKEIMNSFAFDLHNGYIEGINNQTKVIKRNAFGFRRFDRFRARILLHHQYKKKVV
ncbi:ISL3 family transposase [Oceanobacillus iheyensis]|uniref:ISL3 family transposase n=1 Tax=Oceanobacillus iheyensis TaxID=182710 RepID=UPI0009D6E1A8|nr:ISL3 family transposase [Oceanobacillus iheyensis]